MSNFPVSNDSINVDVHQENQSSLDLKSSSQTQRQTKHRRLLQTNLDRDSSSDSSESNVHDRSPMMMSEADSKPASPGQDGLGMINRKLYDRIYYLNQVIGLLIIILIVIWCIQFLGGFGFENPGQTFNFHPLFMFIGFMAIYSNAILIYRSFRMEMKQKLKILHTIMNGSVMIISFFGSLSAIYFHQKANITHFYSLHSWLGISTWLMFIMQFCFGFVSFLFPGASFTIRKTLMPFHRYFGVAIFALASATCLTGLNEKAIFAFKKPAYSAMAVNGITTNLIGLFLCIYCGITIYLVTKPEYERRPLPEEQVINLNFDLTTSN